MRFLSRINGIIRLIWAFRSSVPVTTDKTLALSDAGTYQDCTNTTAITITIPANIFADAPDAEIEVARNGAGAVNFAVAANVTLNGSTAVRSISAQYQAVVLKRRALNTWVIHGAYI